MHTCNCTQLAARADGRHRRQAPSGNRPAPRRGQGKKHEAPISGAACSLYPTEKKVDAMNFGVGARKRGPLKFCKTKPIKSFGMIDFKDF